MAVSVNEVFGVKKDMILSYIEREKVDLEFNRAATSDKHIVIYGSSKQGKSALVQKHVKSNDAITIGCTPRMATKEIYSSLLRQIGVTIESSTEETKGTNGNVSVRTGFKAIIPFFGQADTQVKADLGSRSEQKTVLKTIEFNLEIAQDINEILKICGFNKFVILENFHYLTEDVQKELAFDFRLFQENGHRFIILGIWKEKNRLIQFNGDLVDRVVEIPVEPWTYQDFDKVIQKGNDLLNTEFSSEIIEEIKNISFGNIGIVQELCKETCFAAGIDEKLRDKKEINDKNFLTNAIELKTSQYSSRHLRALESIADAGQVKEGLFMPYYLVCSILERNVDDLVVGISRSDLHNSIKQVHYRPDSVRPGDISYLLHGLSELQSKKLIVPPLFDYDRVNRRVRVIDSTLYFFLKFADKREIIDEIPNPTENLSS